jgi:hypothetical protein
MVLATMIIKAADRNGTEQFYLGGFGMEALKRSKIPDINNRPNKYHESITLRNDNGYQMINDCACILKATKKRDSPTKLLKKVTPTQSRKPPTPSPAPDSSSSSSSSSYSSSSSSSEENDDEDNDNDTDKEPGNYSDENNNDDNDNDKHNHEDNNMDSGKLSFMNEEIFDRENDRIASV